MAGVPSTLPAASDARTRKSCAPAARPVYCFGAEQAANAAPSSEHSNVEPCSLAEKPKLALVLDVVAAGLESIVACGAVVSAVQSWLAGVSSTFPAASVARPWEGCGPSAP